MVRLTFKQPWLAPVVTPVIVVQRSRARSDPAGKPGDRDQPLQFDSLATEPADKLARATVGFDTTVNHRPLYRIALTLLLDPTQVAACQAEPHPAGR